MGYLDILTLIKLAEILPYFLSLKTRHNVKISNTTPFCS